MTNKKENLLGFEIYTESAMPCSGINVYLKNIKYGFKLPVTGENLKEFGFYTAGPELGVISIKNSEYNKTYEDRLKSVVNILSEAYNESRKQVTYWSIQDFMRSRDLPTKKLIESFKYTFDYLKLEFQDLWKFSISEALKEDK